MVGTAGRWRRNNQHDREEISTCPSEPNGWLTNRKPLARWSRLYSMLTKPFVKPIDRKKRIVRSSSCSATSGAAQQLAVRPI